MTADPDDDEALRWEGDAEPSFVPAPAAAPAPVVEPASSSATSPSSSDAGPAAGTSSFLLVTYGILAGAYLIYTIGWLAPIVSDPRVPNPDLLGELMVRLAQVLAIAAPAIWYGASLLLTRGRRPIVRLLALLGGLVVLLPWPYLLLGV
jgi:hypothetical protein